MAKQTKEGKVSKGSKVLIKQDFSSIKPSFDQIPYTVAEVKSTQVTARNGEKERINSKLNIVKERLPHLKTRISKEMEINKDSDD